MSAPKVENLDVRRQTFGELLRDLRLAAGFSQEELAERARLSIETISALERGRRSKPYRQTIGLLANALRLNQSDRVRLERSAGPTGMREPVSPFPPLHAVRNLPNNLPTTLSSFVGREQDAAEIQQLVSSHRLVTLVGAGGIGKSRLALRVAGDLLDTSIDGIWYVDFAPLTDISMVPAAIAAALKEQELPNRPQLETLVAYLTGKQVLLVLDNCVHVVEGAAKTVDAILHACPRVRILATSREALAISGEHVYHVLPLSFPSKDEQQLLDAETALQYSAIKLFVDRAAAANAHFIFDEHLVPIVSEVCRQLDGLPFAIELAAARIKALSARTIAEKLQESFSILTGGNRTALPRYRTMRALIDWSYDLLGPEEQQLLRRLSIFYGGFTLELATALYQEYDGPPEWTIVDLVSSLVDKSLVQVESNSGEMTRYRLLESTRQYAFEKLGQSGEYDAIARKRALGLLALANHFESALELLPDHQWTVEVKPELENVRAALEWALKEREDPLIGQRLAGALREFWFAYAPVEGRRWIHAALETCNDTTPPKVEATIEIAQAHLAFLLDRSPSKKLAAAERALLLFKRAGDRLGAAEAQIYYGLALSLTHTFDDSERLLRAALDTADSLDAKKLVALAMYALARVCTAKGDLSLAVRGLYHEALSLYRAAGCDQQAGRVILNLAEFEFRAGQTETALRLGAEAAKIFRANSNWLSLAAVISDCSAYSIELARFEEARTFAREALTIAREAGFEKNVDFAFQHLAAIAALRGESEAVKHRLDYERSARLLGFVDAHIVKLESTRLFTEQREYEKVLRVLRKALGPSLDELMSEGQDWLEDRAITEAFTI